MITQILICTAGCTREAAGRDRCSCAGAVTSVGAALTAGAAALFFEWGIVRGNYYGMNTEVIRQILIRGARTVVDIAYPNLRGDGVCWIYHVLSRSCAVKQTG